MYSFALVFNSVLIKWNVFPCVHFISRFTATAARLISTRVQETAIDKIIVHHHDITIMSRLGCGLGTYRVLFTFQS